MKILYLCTYYHRAMIFRDAMNALERIGDEVQAFNAVVKNATIAPKYRSIMDEKVIHRECFSKWDRFFYPLKQQKIQKALERSMSVKQYDLLHSHMLFNGGLVCYWLYHKYHIPYVVTVRSTDINTFLKIPFFKYIARKIVKHASGILFLSHPYRQTFFERLYGHKTPPSIIGKTSVLPNGLENFWLEHIADVKTDPHTPLQLLCIGKIDKNKNMLQIIQVMEKLQKQGIPSQLTIIGQQVDSDVYQQLSNNPNVQIMNYQTKENLLTYYRKCDLFILPSIFESFGRVYAEAMTQGLPIVYTRGQGFDGLFAAGEVGFPVAAHDSDEMTHAIQTILKNYSVISHRCIANSMYFNWDEIAHKLHQFYNRSVTKE